MKNPSFEIKKWLTISRPKNLQNLPGMSTSGQKRMSHDAVLNTQFMSKFPILGLELEKSTLLILNKISLEGIFYWKFRNSCVGLKKVIWEVWRQSCQVHDQITWPWNETRPRCQVMRKICIKLGTTSFQLTYH